VLPTFGGSRSAFTARITRLTRDRPGR
jgi:hypothetical protein